MRSDLRIAIARLLLALALPGCFACAVQYGNAPWRPPPYFDVEHHTEIDGLRICYLEAGLEHEETIVFVHGWSGNVHNYWAQYEHFARNYHVLVYDQPGHGKSERAPGVEYDLDLFGRTLIGMMDDRKIEQATVVANSAGGAIALWAATRHPERVKKLVLSNSTGSGLNGFPGAILHTVTPRGLRKFNLTTGKRYVGDDPRTRAKREFIGSFYGTVEEEPYLEMLTASLPSSYRKFPPKALARLTMPILLIWSDRDPVLGRAPRRYFARHLPKMQLYVVEGGGHTPMQKKPEDFDCAVERFLHDESPDTCRKGKRR